MKRSLLAASPLEDSAGTAVVALLQSSSPLLWTSFQREGNGPPQAGFIWPTTSFEVRILKLVGKIPGVQSGNKLLVHLCPLADKVLLAKISMQPLGHRKINTQGEAFLILTLAPLPLIEQRLDHFQHKASG